MPEEKVRRLYDQRSSITNRYGDEELVFVNWSTFAKEPSFHIKEAGLTLPDPGYRIVRPEWGEVYDYMYVLEYVQEGRGIIELDGGSYPIEKGDSYFINKRVACVYYSDPKEPLKKAWINCAGSLVDSLVEFCRLTEPLVIAKVNTEHYFHAVHGLLREVGRFGKYEAYRQSIQRISDILSAIHYAAESSGQVQGLAERIRLRIDDSPYYQISPDEIAAAEHYSIRHINRVFGEQYGVTPKQYILERKIEIARDMLSDRRYSMKEIAELLGFCDEHHFMNTFKRLTGESAGSWRGKKGI